MNGVWRMRNATFEPGLGSPFNLVNFKDKYIKRFYEILPFFDFEVNLRSEER